MTDNNEEYDISKYADDIKTIKTMLMKVDERPFIENWAFLSWGALCLLGTLAHWVGWKSYLMSHGEIFYKIWVPVLVIGGILETIAWIHRLAKDSLPAFNRQAQKFFIALAILSIVFVYSIYGMYKLSGYQYIPSMIISFFAIAMAFYGSLSYFHLNFTGIFLVAGALFTHFIPMDLGYKYLLASSIPGIGFILSGYANIIADRRKHGT